MKLLSVLQDLEKSSESSLVDQELERIAFERGVPHMVEACRECRIGAVGEWVYCKRAREHVDHVHHRCPIQQACDCSLSS